MFRIVISAFVGNGLEFYDIVVYSYFSPFIAMYFFPQEDKITGLISSFAVFFVGYLARPLGALFFGRIGDTLGRKSALVVSIWLMALSTFSLGLLPTYTTIGVWAPILLVILRLLQGFSFGGEYVGSIIFLVEHAPKTQRGFYGSFGETGSNLGFLFASFLAWIFLRNCGDSPIMQWAWRLPFLFGVVVGIVGWLIRRNLEEAQLFRDMRRIPETYFAYYREYIKHLRKVFLIIGLILFGTVLEYLLYVFMVTYMDTVLQYTRLQALRINIISLIFLMLLQPFMGKLSDRIGRRPVLAIALISTIIWIWPYFWLLQQHSFVLALLAQGIITLFNAAYWAVVTVTMVEIVPTYMRFSAVALAYAIAASFFGGITPLAATLLFKTTHSYVSLVMLLLICALISLFTVYKIRETKPKTIEQSIKEDIRQIARNMLANGDNIEKVAAVTALSKEEVATLQSNKP